MGFKLNLKKIGPYGKKLFTKCAAENLLEVYEDENRIFPVTLGHSLFSGRPSMLRLDGRYSSSVAMAARLEYHGIEDDQNAYFPLHTSVMYLKPEHFLRFYRARHLEAFSEGIAYLCDAADRLSDITTDTGLLKALTDNRDQINTYTELMARNPKYKIATMMYVYSHDEALLDVFDHAATVEMNAASRFIEKHGLSNLQKNVEHSDILFSIAGDAEAVQNMYERRRNLSPWLLPNDLPDKFAYNLMAHHSKQSREREEQAILRLRRALDSNAKPR